MRGERGRKSGKRDYHVYAVLPEGQRREKEREKEREYNRLISPRCLSEKRRKKQTRGGRREGARRAAAAEMK